MTGAATRQPARTRRYRELARATPTGALDRELLLEGLHLLAEAHASGLTIDSAAFARDTLATPEGRALAERLTRSGSDVSIVSRKVLEAMSPVQTPSGAIGIGCRSLVPLSSALCARSPTLAVLAHDVQDPGNVGALMRAAEAAGATAFVACGSTADPFGWKALRGSMGSALRLPIVRARTEAALDECAARGIQVAALAPRKGEAFFAVDFRPPTAFLLGNEGAGLPSMLLRRADCRLTIPMTAPVESLNVAVAAALVLYEAYRQRR